MMKIKFVYFIAFAILFRAHGAFAQENYCGRYMVNQPTEVVYADFHDTLVNPSVPYSQSNKTDVKLKYNEYTEFCKYIKKIKQFELGNDNSILSVLSVNILGIDEAAKAIRDTAREVRTSIESDDDDSLWHEDSLGPNKFKVESLEGSRLSKQCAGLIETKRFRDAVELDSVGATALTGWGTYYAKEDDPKASASPGGPWDRLSGRTQEKFQASMTKKAKFFRDKIDIEYAEIEKKFKNTMRFGLGPQTYNDFLSYKKDRRRVAESLEKVVRDAMRTHIIEIAKGAYLVQKQRECAVHMAIMMGTGDQQSERKFMSSDGKIKCLSRGIDTQDFAGCKSLVDAYEASGVIDLGNQLYQTGESANQASKAVEKVAADPGDVLGAQKAQKSAAKTQARFATTRAALNAAKIGFVAGALNSIPDVDTLETRVDDIIEILGKNANYGNAHYRYYIDVVNNVSDKTFLPVFDQQRDVFNFLYKTRKAAGNWEDIEIGHYQAPKILQEVFSLLDRFFPKAYATGQKLPKGEELGEFTGKLDGASADTKQAVKSAQDKFRDAMAAQMRVYNSHKRNARSTKAVSSRLETIDFYSGNGKQFYLRAHDVHGYLGNRSKTMVEMKNEFLSSGNSQSYYLPNQDAREIAKALIKQNIGEGIGNALQALTYKDIADDIGDAIAQGEAPVDGDAPDFDDSFILPQCLSDPFLPECNPNSPFQSNGFAGSDFTFGGGGGRNTTIGGTDGRGPAGSGANGAAQDISSVGLGLGNGNSLSKKDKSSGLLDPRNAAGTVTTTPGTVAGTEGGGGAAGGAAAAGLSGASGGNNSLGGRENRSPGTDVATAYGGGVRAGYYNSGSGLGKGNDKSGGAFSNLFGKKGKGAKGKIQNFRNVASKEFGDGSGIFDRISRRYGKVYTSGGRLVKYKATK